MLRQILEQLRQGKTDYNIALNYAIARDGSRPSRPDKYLGAVQKMLSQPERAQYENLEILFQVLGVNITAAIAIAASQTSEIHPAALRGMTQR
jgi:hypothetical protein